MADSSDTIVCVYDEVSDLWFAHFESFPPVRFDGTVPMKAVRRLLEATGAEPANYPFQCDPIEGVPDVAYRMVGWNPPDEVSLAVWPIVGPHCLWPRQGNQPAPTPDAASEPD